MSAVNPDQLDTLVNFMDKHQDLAKGLLNSSVGRAKARHLWQSLSMKLNSRGPPMKPVEKWKKVWSDHKYHVKRKLLYVNSKKGRHCSLPLLQKRTVEITGLCDSIKPIPEAKSFGVHPAVFEKDPPIGFCSNETFDNCQEIYFKEEPEEEPQEIFDDSAEYITLDNYVRDSVNFNDDFQAEFLPRMYVMNHNEAPAATTQNLSFICDVKNNSKENSLYENIKNHSTTNIGHSRHNISFNDPPKEKHFLDSKQSGGPSDLHYNAKCSETDFKFSSHIEEDIKIRKEFYKTVLRLLDEQNSLKKEEINIKKVKMEQREQYKEKKISQDFEYKKQELELKKLEIETRKLAYEIELKKLNSNSS